MFERSQVQHGSAHSISFTSQKIWFGNMFLRIVNELKMGKMLILPAKQMPF